jgi:protocatechuate 3,4-dioxygenase beta subunit
MDQDQPRLTRRRLVQLGVALPLPLVLAACDAGGWDGEAAWGTTAAPASSGAAPATTAARALPPTPACDDGDDLTPAQTEGPYFTPNSPERGSLLEAGMAGDRLTVAGTVLATDGRFRLETIVPGLYPGRTRHIHVKVQAPDRPVLTTQLYFPGEPANASDGIFREELLLDMRGDRQGSFTFVLEI